MNENTEIFKLILSAIGPLLIILGWIFIRRNAHSFAVRSEMLSVAKEVTSITDTILEVSLNYWLNDAKTTKYSSFSYETLILSYFNRIVSKKNIIEKYNPNFNLVNLKGLKQALTLKSKNTETIENHGVFSDIVENITKINNQIDLLSSTNRQTPIEKLINLHPTKTGIILGCFIIIAFLSIGGIISYLN